MATNANNTQMPQFLREASQPGMCVLHFAFKLAAVVSYLLLNLLLGNLIVTYIVVMTLVIADFWVVKNVTGRYATFNSISLGNSSGSVGGV